LVLFLQKNPRFGNYCYYGCHCLPEGSHELGKKTFGKTVDRIDGACKAFNQCYQCLKLESGKNAEDNQGLERFGKNSETDFDDEVCEGARTAYRFSLRLDVDTGKKDVVCLNAEGTCQRNVCECDKKLAFSLSRLENTWNKKYHSQRNWKGDWVYSNECVRGGGGNNYTPAEQCCGDSFPNKIPQQGGKQCCGYRPFDLDKKHCCDAEKSKVRATEDECSVEE
jgi:hypothetical protein